MASLEAHSHITSTTTGQYLPFNSYFQIQLPSRWQPFDPVRNWPDLGPRFAAGERVARQLVGAVDEDDTWTDHVVDDKRDLDWSMVLKRTFEAYIRGEAPNLYGEHLIW